LATHAASTKQLELGSIKLCRPELIRRNGTLARRKLGGNFLRDRHLPHEKLQSLPAEICQVESVAVSGRRMSDAPKAELKVRHAQQRSAIDASRNCRCGSMMWGVEYIKTIGRSRRFLRLRAIDSSQMCASWLRPCAACDFLEQHGGANDALRLLVAGLWRLVRNVRTSGWKRAGIIGRLPGSETAMISFRRD